MAAYLVGDQGYAPWTDSYQKSVILFHQSPLIVKVLEGLVGFEPTTACLKGKFSTAELQTLSIKKRACRPSKILCEYTRVYCLAFTPVAIEIAPPKAFVFILRVISFTIISL